MRGECHPPLFIAPHPFVWDSHPFLLVSTLMHTPSPHLHPPIFEPSLSVYFAPLPPSFVSASERLREPEAGGGRGDPPERGERERRLDWEQEPEPEERGGREREAAFRRRGGSSNLGEFGGSCWFQGGPVVALGVHLGVLSMERPPVLGDVLVGGGGGGGLWGHCITGVLLGGPTEDGPRGAGSHLSVLLLVSHWDWGFSRGVCVGMSLSVPTAPPRFRLVP